MDANPIESIQQGIVELFQTGDDAQMVKQIGSVVQQAHERANAKEKRAHELIRDLLEAVSKMEDDATRPEPEEVITARFAELEKQRAEAETKRAACQEEERSRNAELDALDSKISAVQKERSTAESETSTHVTAAQNCNSLYKSATGIKWDYSRADAIAGTAINPHTGHMASFEVDPMTMSDFEIANAIWNAIDEQ